MFAFPVNMIKMVNTTVGREPWGLVTKWMVKGNLFCEPAKGENLEFWPQILKYGNVAFPSLGNNTCVPKT